MGEALIPDFPLPCSKAPLFQLHELHREQPSDHKCVLFSVACFAIFTARCQMIPMVLNGVHSVIPSQPRRCDTIILEQSWASVFCRSALGGPAVPSTLGAARGMRWPEVDLTSLLAVTHWGGFGPSLPQPWWGTLGPG